MSYKQDMNERVSQMLDVESRLLPPPSLRVTAFSQDWLWLERYRRIGTFTATSLGSAMAGMLLVSLLWMPPWLAVAVTFTVESINAMKVRTMGLIGLQLNVSTLVNLVMAVGFSVDYAGAVARRPARLRRIAAPLAGTFIAAPDCRPSQIQMPTARPPTAPTAQTQPTSPAASPACE